VAAVLSPYALIGIETLKLALAIDVANTTEDDTLTYLVNMATMRVEQDAHRPLRWRDQYVEHFDGTGQPDLLLPLYPITAVSSITLNGGTPLTVWLVGVDDPAPDGWQVAIYARSGRANYSGSSGGWPAGYSGGWPVGVANIRAQWAGGYGAPNGDAIPEDLQEATVLIAADGYQTRKAGAWNTMSLALQGQTLAFSPDLLWRRYRSCLNPYRDLPL
jgi:hypothetical protein